MYASIRKARPDRVNPDRLIPERDVPEQALPELHQPGTGLSDLGLPEQALSDVSGISAMARDFPSGHQIAPHRHGRAQLVYAATGVMRVSTPAGTWITPPQRAVWVPAGIEHRISMVGAVAMRTLYIAGSHALTMPDHCAVVEVRPLLRELILAMIGAAALTEGRAQNDSTGVPQTGRRRPTLIAALIQEELQAVSVVPLRIPMARDPRLARLCDAVIRDPADRRSLEDWGMEAGASARTLARLSRQELGMSFGSWRQQVRLAEALSRMALGRPVAAAAREAGYSSASAFAAMFRRVLGTTPSAYLQAVSA